ncbi:MAG: hypothetical protein JJU02_07880 [Cryomorphaceae bacterium]|nr:hypothetical protein [Cryomorphaceae bacterium]
MANPVIHTAQYLPKGNVHVEGSKDYRSTLFKIAPKRINVPPFFVDWAWNVNFEGVDVTDSTGFFKYLMISIDTASSFIREDFADQSEEIGQVILDILELHRREMMLSYIDEPLEGELNQEVANAVSTALISALQISMGGLPTAMFDLIDEEWDHFIVGIENNCRLMLLQFSEELERGNGLTPSQRKEQTQLIQSNYPEGIIRRFSKNIFGVSIGLGAQANMMDGGLSSPFSTSAIRPVFQLDFNVRNVLIYGQLSGISLSPQSNIQLGDIALNDDKRNFFTFGGFSLGYAISLNKSFRIVPEVSRMFGTFRDDPPELDNPVFYEFNFWGWGLRFQPGFFPFTSPSRNYIGFGYFETEWFFRHFQYSTSTYGGGNMFTIGVVFSARVDYHRKYTVRQ